MDSPAWMFTKALTHRQKVLRLFKRAMRQCDHWHAPDMLDVRLHRVLLRARFDRAAGVKDPAAAQKMLMEGCEEIWRKKHPVHLMAATDPAGGIAFGREAHPADEAADNADWLEREQFPYYHNRRLYRKKEIYGHWEKIEAAWDAELAAIQRKPPPETTA